MSLIKESTDHKKILLAALQTMPTGIRRAIWQEYQDYRAIGKPRNWAAIAAMTKYSNLMANKHLWDSETR